MSGDPGPTPPARLGPGRALRRANGLGLRQHGVYRPRAGTRKGPRHPLAMPLDEYGTPYADEPNPFVDEVRRVLR